jgi:hypothetical protein
MASTLNQDLLLAADDILRQLVRFLDALSIQRLSGTCPRMKTRLLNGTIVESLRFVNLVQTRQLPKMVSTFSHLSELVLVLPYCDRRYIRLEQSFVSHLPKTLRKLHFNFLGAHSIWFEGFSIGRGPAFHTFTNFSDERTKPLDLVKILPNISEMRLGGENRQAAMRLIHFLPKTLTVFVVYTCIWSMETKNETWLLPPNLRLYKSDLALQFSDDVFRSSPSLETLILIKYPCNRPFKFLPYTLTHLDMEGARVEKWGSGDFDWLGPLVHLKNLNIASVHILPFLGDKLALQKLTLKSCVLTPNSVRLLPGNLKELIMESLLLQADVESSYDFWPKELVHLEFTVNGSNVPAPDSQFWKEMPKTLTLLDAKTAADLSSLPMACWPPQIKIIDWRQGRGDYPPAEVSDFSQNKHSTDITLHFDDWVESTSYKVILPDKLRKFSWSGWCEKPFHIAKDGINLPSTLTSISLLSCVEIGNQWMKQLPRGLIELNLRLRYTVPASIDEDGLLDLPPHLSFISIHIKPNSDANAFFPKLPKHLKTISFCRIAKIEDSLFKHLPRESLRVLDLPNIQGLTDAALPHLPRSLTSLRIPRNHPITPEAFFALKLPLLQYIDFRKNPNFTRKKVLALAPPLLGFKTKKITREPFFNSDSWLANQNL